jgi:hypothetical protein
MYAGADITGNYTGDRHMPRTKIITLALVAALAVTAIVADTATANTRSLNLLEGEGVNRQPLAPGATFDMNTFTTTTLVTSDGYSECPGEAGLEGQMESAIALLGTLETNRDPTDTGLLAGGRNLAMTCKSTLDLGEASILLFSFGTLSLASNGKVEVAPLTVGVAFTGGADCLFETADAAGRMAVSSAAVPTTIVFPGARLKRNTSSGAPICPKAAKLYVEFHAVGENGEQLYDSN